MKLTAAQQEAAYEAQQGRDHAPFQRWQHGSAWTATDGTQHVASTVAALRKSGKIGDPEVAAAARFYADYAFASGAHDPEKSGSGGSVDGYNISQIDAITRTNAVKVALKSEPWLLVFRIVVNEQSLRHLAGGNGFRRDRILGKVLAALKALSDHYANTDGSRAGKASPIRALGVARGAT